jgi:WD40 repeat protein
MLCAVAIFEHCSVEFFDLTAQDGKLQFTALPDKKMTSIHKMPVKQVRLSKKQPSIMVSCGDESDLFVKLWSVGKSEPLSQVQTNQIRHKFMAQSHDLDYYSVAAKTSEVRIFQVTLHQGQVKGLEKAMAMTSHKREVLSVAYDSQSGKYCATTAKD